MSKRDRSHLDVSTSSEEVNTMVKKAKWNDLLITDYLHSILQCLNQGFVLRRCSLVCKKWHHHIMTMHPVAIQIKSNDDFLVLQHTSMNITSLVMKALHLNALLRFLTDHPCPNLKKLKITDGELQKVPEEELAELLSLPSLSNLTNLSLEMDVRKSVAEHIGNSVIFSNLTRLNLASTSDGLNAIANSPNLKRLTCLKCSPYKEEDLEEIVSSSLGKQLKHLKTCEQIEISSLTISLPQLERFSCVLLLRISIWRHQT